MPQKTRRARQAHHQDLVLRNLLNLASFALPPFLTFALRTDGMTSAERKLEPHGTLATHSHTRQRTRTDLTPNKRLSKKYLTSRCS